MWRTSIPASQQQLPIVNEMGYIPPTISKRFIANYLSCGLVVVSSGNIVMCRTLLDVIVSGPVLTYRYSLLGQPFATRFV